jgi:hypothetical protein
VSEESLRRPEKCSGRSSLAARNRWQDQWCQGTTGGGYRQWGAHGGRRWQGNSHCPALLAGATGRLLVQEGHGDEALLFVWSDNSKAAHRRLAMACEVVVSAEQSSKEAAVEQCEGKQNGWWPPLLTGGPGTVIKSHQFPNSIQTCKFKKKPSLLHKYSNFG